MKKIIKGLLDTWCGAALEARRYHNAYNLAVNLKNSNRDFKNSCVHDLTQKILQDKKEAANV